MQHYYSLLQVHTGMAFLCTLVFLYKQPPHRTVYKVGHYSGKGKELSSGWLSSIWSEAKTNFISIKPTHTVTFACLCCEELLYASSSSWNYCRDWSQAYENVPSQMPAQPGLQQLLFSLCLLPCTWHSGNALSHLKLLFRPAVNKSLFNELGVIFISWLLRCSMCTYDTFNKYYHS